jgi:hypothetical protein
MRAFSILVASALGLGFFSGCGGGDSPRAVGGAGTEGAEGGSGATSEGIAGDSSEPREGSSGKTGSDDDDDDGTSGSRDCEDGTRGCACYGNDTCDKPYRCEDGVCVGCEDGDEGCSCYGNDTCNGSLKCKAGLCIDEQSSGQGGAPAGTGGDSSDPSGGTAPEGTGGDAPEGSGGTGPEGTGGRTPEGTGGQEQGTGGQVEGTGGQEQGTGGQVEGTGGSTATGCADPLVIDDFEDGDHDACPRLGWTSDWWADGDDYGSASPSIASIQENKDVLSAALDPARGTSQRGLHLEGAGFIDWGIEIGLTFNNPGEEIPQVVDLSQYTGVTFWVRGTGTVQLQVPTVETMPASAGGDCSGEYPYCYDYFKSSVFALGSTWTQRIVRFDSLEKGYLGTSMSVTDQYYILNLLFFAGNAGDTFDLWLDDVAFY